MKVVEWLRGDYWDEAGFKHKNWTYPPIWIGVEYLLGLVTFIVWAISKCI